MKKHKRITLHMWSWHVTFLSFQESSLAVLHTQMFKIPAGLLLLWAAPALDTLIVHVIIASVNVPHSNSHQVIFNSIQRFNQREELRLAFLQQAPDIGEGQRVSTVLLWMDQKTWLMQVVDDTHMLAPPTVDDVFRPKLDFAVMAWWILEDRGIHVVADTDQSLIFTWKPCWHFNMG